MLGVVSKPKSGLLAMADNDTGTSAACRIKCWLDRTRSFLGYGATSGLVSLIRRRILNRLVGVECRQRLRMAEQVRFLEQTERAVGINPAIQISLRPNRRQILWDTVVRPERGWSPRLRSSILFSWRPTRVNQNKVAEKSSTTYTSSTTAWGRTVCSDWQKLQAGTAGSTS